MGKTFKNKLSQDFHIHFGYIYDQNGKKIKPDEIVEWFEKKLPKEKEDSQGSLWADVRDIFIKEPNALQILPKQFSISKINQNK